MEHDMQFDTVNLRQPIGGWLSAIALFRLRAQVYTAEERFHGIEMDAPEFIPYGGVEADEYSVYPHWRIKRGGKTPVSSSLG